MFGNFSFIKSGNITSTQINSLGIKKCFCGQMKYYFMTTIYMLGHFCMLLKWCPREPLLKISGKRSDLIFLSWCNFLSWLTFPSVGRTTKKNVKKYIKLKLYIIQAFFQGKDLKSRKKSRTVTAFYVTIRIPLQKRLESRKMRRNKYLKDSFFNIPAIPESCFQSSLKVGLDKLLFKAAFNLFF